MDLQVNDLGNKNFVQLIKQCAIDAVNASKPCGTYIGKVTKVKPLKVSINQKMTVNADFLDVCETLTGSNSLKKGDIVLLIRQQGGQKYTIIDRVKKGVTL